MTASVLALSCATDHHVSPWGAARKPPLFAYVAPPDLDAHLRAIDVEAAELGLTLDIELRGGFGRGRGDTVVVRGYSGIDALGRPTTAVRAATPHGVVMAVGPLEARADRRQATQLVPSLVPGATPDATEQLGAFRSGTDLNRDGAPDVVLRNEAGEIEIWSVRPLGAARYDVELAVPPRFALDVDQDGSLELAGQVHVEEGDPIAPELLDVASFEGGRYTHRGAAARAFHAARAGERQTGSTAQHGSARDPAQHGSARDPAQHGNARDADPREGVRDANPREGARDARPSAAEEGPQSDAGRLRRALEQAWHALLAGRPAREVLERLDRTPVPPALREAFAAHRARVARLAAASPQASSPERAPRGAGGAPTRPPEASGRPAGT